MLDQLLATPGVREQCVLGSRFGFLALHGGLEAGTAEIARAAAVASNASIYAVVQPDDVRWHVPSHAFDPAHSCALVEFLAHVEQVVSVHGFGGLRGVHPDNPVNRVRDGGVQIELPPRVRKTPGDCAALVGALASLATA